MVREGKRYIDVGKSSYWCEIIGQGKPVVLLHGFTGSTATWKAFIEELEGPIQTITIDLPGHGKTKVAEPKSMIDCCKDIKSIVNKLGFERIHLLGYSMGGRTALSLAANYPEIVQSLILESASPGLYNEADRKERLEKDQILAQRLRTEGMESFVNFWENIPLFASQKKLSKSLQQAVRTERLSQCEEGLAMSLMHMGTGVQPSWWDQLESVSMPVLQIVGEEDSKFININEMMEKQLPNSDLIVVKNAGHAIHVEQSKIFGKIVSEFLLDKNQQIT